MGREYQVDYNRYSFNAEDDWGYYDNGERKEAKFNPDGYASQWYKCTDEKYHKLPEHIAKWEYFNTKIPEDYEIDHIIPISSGGTNKLSNLRIVTHYDNCNNPKTLENRGKKVYQYDLEGNLINSFISIKDAARKTGFNFSMIRAHCVGKYKNNYKNFKWYFK